ncbi:NADH:flavin oxidoreductase/NADH oxidase [Paenarthrobacter nicotinovorans]|uniref:NADH:flavin oxidoreductase/NADH oxidase n=1 Tax=Paenarthrobacter nicotinovorans TaxID=29320 RepID=UPI00382B6808
MLFEPFQLRELTIPNRLWMAPMGNWAALPHPSAPGRATDFHVAHYGARAASGLGLVVVEATAVSAAGRGTDHDMGLWRDDQIEPLRRVSDAIRHGGAVPAIQINHSARKGSLKLPWEGEGYIATEDGGWELTAPSPVAAPGLPTPRELTLDDIGGIVEDYREAARRALAAGFAAIEIHAAHGYLLHTFLSPVSNFREDKYGGSLQNRMRLTLEIVDAIRSVWPTGLPLLLRISATDWLEGRSPAIPSWTLNDSAILTREAYERGVDLVDVSSGGMAAVPIPSNRTYQTDLAAELKRRTQVPVGAVGRITTASQANDLLLNGHADVVLVGRSLLRNASWANDAALELGCTPRYLRSYAHFLNKQSLEKVS